MTEEEFQSLVIQAKEAEFVVGKTAEVLMLKEKVKAAKLLRGHISFWKYRVTQSTRQLSFCKFPWAVEKWQTILESHIDELKKAKEAFKIFE